VADSFGMIGRDNRRLEARKPKRVRAWADPGGVAPVVDCVIVDISKDGARVKSVNAQSRSVTPAALKAAPRALAREYVPLCRQQPFDSRWPWNLA
jgi:hypothetical protein